MPISRVRCVTRYVATPYAPPIASRNASTANTASIHESAARSAVDRRITSSIVRTRNNGISGSIRRNTSRSAGAIDVASTLEWMASVIVDRWIHVQRKVDAWPHRTLEAVVLDVAGDADHGEPWGVVASAESDSPADRVGAFAPERPHERFIHDDRLKLLGTAIGVLKESAATKTNPHRAEVPGRGRAA